MAAAAPQDDEQQLISDKWTVQVQELLRAKEPIQVCRATTRLPMAMVNAKANAYIPQLVSLGPYHHRALKDVSVGPYQNRLSHISQMEMYKLKFARDVADGNVANIEQVFSHLMEPSIIDEVKGFYDWSIAAHTTELENFCWMMTVDAFFLFQFLEKGLIDDLDRSTNALDTMPSGSCVKCDIVKLENQIPLCLLQEVEKNAAQAESFDLQTRVKSLSTFQIRDADIKTPKEEAHLLGCIHNYVSSFLQIQTAEEDKTRPTSWQQLSSKMGNVVAVIGGFFARHPARDGQHDFLNRYSAEELVKAGVTFKPFPDNSPGKIRFDKFSQTLYLPRIEVVDTYTEVLLRNLLALEFNDASRPKAVTHYVELMDCLIDTPADVTLLRQSEVIVRRSMMITDEYVAEMWDGMCKPLLAGVMEPPPALKSQIQQMLIDNYYKSRIKTIWKEFHEEYLAKPWQVVALLVGIFLLALDTIQTYCSFEDCESLFKSGHKSSPTERSSMAFRPFG